ncbi:MAG: DNA starvation/stationary phase protection protein [Candidatus Sumerlaeia bacterium]|nr:DNA starvation/stationary phase protection protein [Candidatus Sumerlaeia bacterium]
MSTHKANPQVTEALGATLSDSYTLLQIAHIYHWNVVGPNFIKLHEFFEEQYTELFTAVDDIAERLRALDVLAPTTLKALRGNGTIGDIDGAAPAEKMVAGYLEATEKLIAGLKKLRKASGDAGDQETEDLAIGRLASHEKTAWMLRSLLK